jgi:SAM-dependent methyltransferase
MSGETFAIPLEIAEAYEERFVPRLFGVWAPHVVDAARMEAGDRVLDVACGTGIVAREVARRLNGTGEVVGLDLHESMLTVARRMAPEIQWRQGDAADLPFEDDAFDAVVCQSGLMFFPEPRAALAEMGRVAKGEGSVVVQVWGSLEDQPAYGPFVDVAARHAGPEAVALLGTYWSWGDVAALQEAFRAAGLEVTSIDTRTEVATFDSIEELVRTEVESTPLVERIDAPTYDAIIAGAEEALSGFASNGSVEIPMAGHIVTARPSSRTEGERRDVRGRR